MWSPESPEETKLRHPAAQEAPASGQLCSKSLDASHRYLTAERDVLTGLDFKIQIPYECMMTKTIEYKLRQVPAHAREAELARLMEAFGLAQVIVARRNE